MLSMISTNTSRKFSSRRPKSKAHIVVTTRVVMKYILPWCDELEGRFLMKIAITTTGHSLDSVVDPRFGRCPYFLVVDTDTLGFEAVENPNIALGGGAGIQSAQLMSEK